MPDFKPGDRVHVEFDMTVTGVGRRLYGRLCGAGHQSVPMDWCTLIAPPVKVGDTLPNEAVMNRLPVGTVVLDALGEVAQKLVDGTDDDDWGWTNYASPHSAAFATFPVKVLHLPEAES